MVARCVTIVGVITLFGLFGAGHKDDRQAGEILCRSGWWLLFIVVANHSKVSSLFTPNSPFLGQRGSYCRLCACPIG